MANPSPKTSQIEAFQAKPVGEEPMAEIPLSVRVSVTLDQAVRALGGRKADWLRAAIAEKAEREGLI